VGHGATVVRWNGTSWSRAQALPTVVEDVTLQTLSLTAVSVRSANDVLVMGNDPAGGRFVTVLFQWNGTRWSAELLPFGQTSTQMVRSFDGTLYIDRAGQIARRAPGATTWTVVPGAGGSIRHLSMDAAGVIELATSDSTNSSLYRLAEATQQFVPLGIAAPMTALHTMISGANATLWTAGANASILRYNP
jgi:hypothetical protein